MIDVNAACRRAITGNGWDETTSEDAIRDDFERLAHSAKTTGTLDVQAALKLWRDERARRYAKPTPEQQQTEQREQALP